MESHHPLAWDRVSGMSTCPGGRLEAGPGSGVISLYRRSAREGREGGGEPWRTVGIVMGGHRVDGVHGRESPRGASEVGCLWASELLVWVVPRLRAGESSRKEARKEGWVVSTKLLRAWVRS